MFYNDMDDIKDFIISCGYRNDILYLDNNLNFNIDFPTKFNLEKKGKFFLLKNNINQYLKETKDGTLSFIKGRKLYINYILNEHNQLCFYLINKNGDRSYLIKSNNKLIISNEMYYFNIITKKDLVIKGDENQELTLNNNLDFNNIHTAYIVAIIMLFILMILIIVLNT